MKSNNKKLKERRVFSESEIPTAKPQGKIFVARFVKMRGTDYYMRLFESGESEFVRYDTDAGKWIFLCFPAA
jgi:hypothetical protein